MNLVGQKNLIDRLSKVASEKFPLFTILVGPDGSEKNKVAEIISNKISDITINCGIPVSEVRNVIINSYKVSVPTTYIFRDADRMSNEAKGALLKVTEEPPNRCYFIMTLENIASVPSTIVSRASVFYADPYILNELENYADSVGIDKIVCNFCDTPEDIDIFKETDPEKFLEYVDLVIDNVAEVGTANSLKIGDKVVLKEKKGDEEKVKGYDLRLFWKAFIYQCMKRAEESLPEGQAFDYAAGAMLTSKYLAESYVVGANKSMLFLDWILQIRREWR